MADNKAQDKTKTEKPKENKVKQPEAKKENKVKENIEPKTENKPKNTEVKADKHEEKIKKAIKITNSDISNIVRVKQKPEFRVKSEKVKGLDVVRLTQDTVIIDSGIAGIRNYEFEIPYIVLNGKGNYVNISLTVDGKVTATVTNNTAVSESMSLLLEIK